MTVTVTLTYISRQVPHTPQHVADGGDERLERTLVAIPVRLRSGFSVFPALQI